MRILPMGFALDSSINLRDLDSSCNLSRSRVPVGGVRILKHPCLQGNRMSLRKPRGHGRPDRVDKCFPPNSSSHFSARSQFFSIGSGFLNLRFWTCVFAASLIAGRLPALEPDLEFPVQGEILKAKFWSWSPKNHSPAGVLVLCPGQNGDGKSFSEDEGWRHFADANHLAILIPHFVSEDAVLLSGRGYFDASRGSGKLLIQALDAKGWGKLPLLVFGFSGDAHFAMSFSAMAPDRVRGFCAYSFSWWKAPPSALTAPALIVCGQHDATRFGSSFAYFQTGRRAGKPWAWVSLKEKDHSSSMELEQFVRLYFQSVLENSGKSCVTVDNVTKDLSNHTDPLMTSILPTSDILSQWQAIHHP